MLYMWYYWIRFHYVFKASISAIYNFWKHLPVLLKRAGTVQYLMPAVRFLLDLLCHNRLNKQKQLLYTLCCFYSKMVAYNQACWVDP